MRSRIASPDKPTETWYHGTDKESFESIRAVGFNRVHNWFAVNVENAQSMGGPYIVGVNFDSGQIPVDEDGSRFQMCVHEHIGPELIQVISQPRHSCPTCGQLCRVQKGEESVVPFGKRTHCKNGHEFSAENTIWRISKGYPSRRCKACDRFYHRRAYARKQAKP